MLVVCFFTKKWTRFNIVLSYLQDGAIYLRCSMLVVYAAGNFFTPKTNSLQHCFIFMQVHPKQNEGGARPCNGFYVLFARRYQLGMKEKNLFKMFHVSGECCWEIMFRPLYQFSYSIQWICWFQDHLKQDEGPARPCNGFYVLFCLCRAIGTIRTTWDGKKIFLKMFHVSGEFSEWNHVPFTCLIFSYSIQRICWFQHPLKRVSAGSCTAGSTGCWQYRSTIKIGIEKRGPL